MVNNADKNIRLSTLYIYIYVFDKCGYLQIVAKMCFCLKAEMFDRHKERGNEL